MTTMTSRSSAVPTHLDADRHDAGRAALASFAGGAARDVASGPDAASLRESIERACGALLRKQRDDQPNFPGSHWCAELEGDSILSSEYMLMKYILGQEDGERERWLLPRLAKQLRLSQRVDGSWGQYPGSPADISACVKSYLCLKLAGDDVNAAHMVRARELIRQQGGAEKINTFSMFYLACLGIVTWEACPAIPPQIVLAPHWAPFHIRRMAAWTRTMILPLALCSALQPVRKLTVNIDELFVDIASKSRLNKAWDERDVVGWTNFFLVTDKLMKLARRVGFTPWRKKSVALCEEWIARRMDSRTTEGLGAIFPPMVYVQVAFQKLGYGRDHPLIMQAEKDLDAFIIDEPNADARLDHTRLQPCFSPVWDTAIAIDALTEAGVSAASDERLARACDWLRAREVKLVGDWIENLRPEHRALRPGLDMACWAFEYRNDWYPDVDDTCMVARALAKAGDRPGQDANRDGAKRAVQWLIAMQNDDGGWAAFDRTSDRAWMEAVPFADHNAMQDPSCSDITGRVVESLTVCGVSPDHPAIEHAVRYMLRTQQPEGCWWGRWGNNYIYGTWQAINGLHAARVAGDHPAMVRARNWLLSIQNADGGFGESANSYLDRNLMGQGPSTPSQTAWGLMTLLNLVSVDHPAIARAARYLMDQQLAGDKPAFTEALTRRAADEAAMALGAGGALNGHAELKPAAGDTRRAHELADVYGMNPAMNGNASGRVRAPGSIAGAPEADEKTLAKIDHVRDMAGGWNEHWFTGTGFPKVFYLRYHLYRHSFPLKALAKLERARNGTRR
jgi:squalene-hopene/tetraprenyl-beta-curcumene cyclase